MFRLQKCDSARAQPRRGHGREEAVGAAFESQGNPQCPTHASLARPITCSALPCTEPRGGLGNGQPWGYPRDFGRLRQLEAGIGEEAGHRG